MTLASGNTSVVTLPTLRLLVAEDEPLFRNLLVTALSGAEALEVVTSVDSGEAALAYVAKNSVDVAVLDIHMAGELTGVAAGVQMRRARPTTGIVLLSSDANPSLFSSLPEDVLGGWAYLLKPSVEDIDAVVRAVRGAAAGLMVLDPALMAMQSSRSWASPIDDLTGRQREVLDLLAQGYTNKAIAERLNLTEKSVENHLSRVYLALGIDATDREVHARVQAALAVVEAVSR